MKKRSLKLQRTKIVNLTKKTSIRGGTGGSIETNLPDGTCGDMTEEITNGNNNVPTFILCSVKC